MFSTSLRRAHFRGVRRICSLLSGVSHGSLSLNSNGSFTYTPNSNWTGTDTFLYLCNDGTSNCFTPGTVSISVTNTAPVANNVSFTGHQGTALTISAPGILSTSTDADGDTLSVSATGGVSHGSISINSNGSGTYTPTSGYVGSDSTLFMPTDGIATAASPATITFTITNTAPTASNSSYTLAGSTLSVSSGNGVLNSASDADSDTLSAALVSNASHGSVTLNPDGSFSYTPSTFTGSDSFTWKAWDGAAFSNTVTVTITGHAPVASADSYVLHGSTVTLSAPGVMSNDTDADSGTTLSATLASAAAHGIASLGSNGSLTSTASGSPTADSFTYFVTDGWFVSSNATVTIATPSLSVSGASLSSKHAGTSTGTLTWRPSRTPTVLFQPPTSPPRSTGLTGRLRARPSRSS